MTKRKPTQEVTRPERSYGDAERINAIFLALDLGVPDAAKALDMPETTIYHWLREDLRVDEIRRLRNEQVIAAQLKARTAIYESVVAHAKDLPLEAFVTYRKLIEAEMAPTSGGPAVAGAEAGAVAGARADLTVIIEGEHIVVPRPEPTGDTG